MGAPAWKYSSVGFSSGLQQAVVMYRHSATARRRWPPRLRVHGPELDPAHLVHPLVQPPRRRLRGARTAPRSTPPARRRTAAGRRAPRRHRSPPRGRPPRGGSARSHPAHPAHSRTPRSSRASEGPSIGSGEVATITARPSSNNPMHHAPPFRQVHAHAGRSPPDTAIPETASASASCTTRTRCPSLAISHTRSRAAAKASIHSATEAPAPGKALYDSHSRSAASMLATYRSSTAGRPVAIITHLRRSPPARALVPVRVAVEMAYSHGPLVPP